MEFNNIIKIFLILLNFYFLKKLILARCVTPTNKLANINTRDCKNFEAHPLVMLLSGAKTVGVPALLGIRWSFTGYHHESRKWILGRLIASPRVGD